MSRRPHPPREWLGPRGPPPFRPRPFSPQPRPHSLPRGGPPIQAPAPPPPALFEWPAPGGPPPFRPRPFRPRPPRASGLPLGARPLAGPAHSGSGPTPHPPCSRGPPPCRPRPFQAPAPPPPSHTPPFPRGSILLWLLELPPAPPAPPRRLLTLPVHPPPQPPDLLGGGWASRFRAPWPQASASSPEPCSRDQPAEVVCANRAATG